MMTREVYLSGFCFIIYINIVQNRVETVILNKCVYLRTLLYIKNDRKRKKVQLCVYLVKRKLVLT